MLNLVHLNELLHKPHPPVVVVHIHYIALLYTSNALDSFLLNSFLRLSQKSYHIRISAMMLPLHFPQSLH